MLGGQRFQGNISSALNDSNICVLYLFASQISVAYEHDFDAIAITPPGHGNTTQVEDEGGGFWSASNFLKHALESCLGVSLARTVVVSHSNFVTRKYFLPFLMVRLAFLSICGA